MSRNVFAQRYFDGRSYLNYLPLFNTMNETLNPLAQVALNPRLASSEEKRKSIDLLYSLQQTLASSPTTSFSLLWRWVSQLYKTRTNPGRVLNSRAVHQGQPKIKRGLCLAPVGALELLSANNWNSLLFSLLYRIGILECRH
jgi:hypothetical protein